MTYNDGVSSKENFRYNENQARRVLYQGSLVLNLSSRGSSPLR